MIEKMPLWIEVEDIYFVTSLSQRGVVMHLTGRTRSSHSVEDYVHIYCPGHPKKIGSQIPIKHVESFLLRILLFSIARVNGSSSLHQVS